MAVLVTLTGRPTRQKEISMDSVTANRLASQLKTMHRPLCQHVSARLLQAYPELSQMLRLEERYSPSERLAEVSVERLNELVRSVLLFELPTLADNELTWAAGVLPRSGVTMQHQSAMVRWFFEEVRRMGLTSAELELTYELERYFLQAISEAYNKSHLN
jgi:hypothetical protein